MSKETGKTTEKDTEKNPYTIRKLVGRWVLALFLMLLVFPMLGVIAPFIQALTLFGMIIYTVRFLLKRKQFVGKKIAK